MTFAIGKRQKENKNGFTFIELLVVILIISIMSIAVSPLLYNLFLQTKLKTEVSKLISIINYLRSTAITNQSNCSLILDITDNCYWMNHFLQGEVYYLNKGIFIKGITTAEGEKFQGPYEIIFNPDGTISEKVSISLQNEKGESYRVEISKVTGMAKAKKWE